MPKYKKKKYNLLTIGINLVKQGLMTVDKFYEDYCPNCGYYCTGKSVFCTKHPDGPAKKENIK